MKQLIDLQKLKIPPAPSSPQLTTNHKPLTTEQPNDPNPEIEQSPDQPQLTTDNRQLTTVFAYTTPSTRVRRAYFGQPQSVAQTAALLARAA